jgi:hypothetical protein
VRQSSAAIELVAAAAGPIQKWCDGWYVFGAQVAILWGRPRLTEDVDITVRLRYEDVTAFCRDMEKAGFQLKVSDPEFLARTRILPFLYVPSLLPLDVVLAGPGIEDQFFQRAVRVEIGDITAPVASPEDLIVMKILAGRTKDIDDVQAVLAERSATLDMPYIRSTLAALEQALDQSDMLPLLEAEIARVQRLRRKK